MGGERESLGLALALALGACQTQSWGVETVYAIEDIDEDAKDRLEAVLKGRYNQYGLQVIDRGDRGEPFTFRLTRLRSLRDVQAVQATIQSVSQHARVPVVLQQADMRFASVYGEGRATIRVSGTATPGASVYLDIGNEEVPGVVDASGRWFAEIRRSSRLSQRGGWIYALIKKGSARQYLRMNVLDTSASQRVLIEDLPQGSPLLRR